MASLKEIHGQKPYEDRNKKELKPVVIKTITDIRRAIVPFTKEYKNSRVEFSSDVKWTDEDGKTFKTNVKAYSTDPNMRQSLLDGFKQVEEQSKLWNNIHDVLEEDEYGASLPQPDIDDFVMPVDRLIRHRLGGKREGKTVVWHVEGKKVVFDPLAKTLDVL